MDEYSLDVVYQIWDDKHGSHIEIGPDADGLDLVEIRYYEPSDLKPSQGISMTKQMAVIVLAALERCLKDQKEAPHA